MKHMRTIEVPQDQAFAVGDIISFALNDGEYMEAMAVQHDGDGMLFCAVDCLADEYPFKRDGKNEGGYEASDLREILNTTILRRFPEELVKQMVPFPSGDLLRIPTEKEIFGTNEWCEDEGDDVKQWEAMKLRRNRIAFQGHNGAWEWYWLMSRLRSVISATYAAYVYNSGTADCYGAGYSLGVRPLFKIKDR
ncbi:MAG: hypothetical protein IJ124_14320 [Clostridia bacterium]|nr:hypothetical protein [Clostridia bacterium]